MLLMTCPSTPVSTKSASMRRYGPASPTMSIRADEISSAAPLSGWRRQRDKAADQHDGLPRHRPIRLLDVTTRRQHHAPRPPAVLRCGGGRAPSGEQHDHAPQGRDRPDAPSARAERSAGERGPVSRPRGCRGRGRAPRSRARCPCSSSVSPTGELGLAWSAVLAQPVHREHDEVADRAACLGTPSRRPAATGVGRRTRRRQARGRAACRRRRPADASRHGQALPGHAGG